MTSSSLVRLGILAGAAAVLSPAMPAWACAYNPGAQVYADACAETSNQIHGQSYYLDGSTLQSTTTDGFTNTTSPAPYQTPGVALPAPSGSASEATHGATMSATAQIGDNVTGSFTDIYFDAGSQTASLRSMRRDANVPNMHASILGAVVSTTGYSAQTYASAAFSDVISVNRAQIALLNKTPALVSYNLRLNFALDGSATSAGILPNGSFADADGSFQLSVQASDGEVITPTAVSYDLSPETPGAGPTPVHQFVYLSFLMRPDVKYLLSGSLTLDGVATSRNDVGASYNIDFANTAQFLGAQFFTDATQTVQLPNFDLNSAYGFNYDPITLDDTDPAAVPEPATLSLLAAGLVALGATRSRLRRAHERQPHAPFGPAHSS